MFDALEIVNAVLEDGESPKDFLRRRKLGELEVMLGQAGFSRYAHTGWKKVVKIADDESYCVVSFAKLPYLSQVRFVIFINGVIDTSRAAPSSGDPLKVAAVALQLADAAEGVGHDYYDNVDGYKEAMAMAWNRLQDKGAWP